MTTSPTASPASTLSRSTTNAILGSFIESGASLEEIANANNVSIPALIDCLDEHMPFLKRLLRSMRLRIRLSALRAEVLATSTLRDMAELDRDPERRRKASAAILAHVAKLRLARKQQTRDPAPPRKRTHPAQSPSPVPVAISAPAHDTSPPPTPSPCTSQPASVMLVGDPPDPSLAHVPQEASHARQT